MAIAFVNGVTSNASAGATTIAAAAQSHTTGNTVVVFTSNYVGTPPAIAVTGVTDTAGNTYTKAGGDYGGDADHRMECWFATNITGHATNVVTITFSATTSFRVIGVIQYSGLHTTSPYDASAAGSLASTGSSPFTSAAVTTTSNDQIVLAWWISWDAAQALTTSGSSTLRAQSGAGAAVDDSAISDRVAATAGAYTVSAAWGGGATRTYAVIVRSFKAAAAAAASRINSNAARMAAMIAH